ncbi:MAG: nucleotidyltransferase substrate binding protein, partial [Bdellovibrionales bacterium]|nr:nucleotidyltransferase substrate binding protein [Bdellovibrionales bacterium]
SFLTISTLEFAKSVKRLEEACLQEKNDFIRDSVIQRFEFCIELAWKTTKKIMGTPTSAPKDIVREMGQNNYIEHVDKWLLAIDMRNLTSHTYKEELAERVYAFAVDFLPELKKLLTKISSI